MRGHVLAGGCFRFACVTRTLGIAAVFAALTLCLMMSPSIAAEADDAQAAIAAHLDAGEFAPALNLARQAPPAQRDQLLGRIAAVQAGAGGRQAALGTAAEILDDQLRTGAIDALSAPPRRGFGGLGGQIQPDFDSVMELIQTTVAPSTWEEVGGPGTIAPYPGGVYADPQGMLQSLLGDEESGELTTLRQVSIPVTRATAAVHESPLRKVSLTRLEKLVQLRLAAGLPLDDDMPVLAGLQRIEYVLVYPETGDIVVAGPAGDWKVNSEGRLVGAESGRPVLRLDDLVVLLRHAINDGGGPLGCSISPIKKSLARTNAFLEASSKSPLRPGRRAAWLADLRDQLGPQSIEYFGIDPRTRVAQVMAEADYRMKLVGIGLERGTLDVPSYLDMLVVPEGQSPPAMDVLRWWFTLNYQSVTASEDRDAFKLSGQGVKVLSENQLLTAQGERLATGKSEPLNQQFAQNFTKHFGALSDKYPVYAELRNVFDLALVAELFRTEALPARVGWDITCFGDPQRYAVAKEHAPKAVETVINHRVINKVHVLAAVSGGVHIDPSPAIACDAIRIDKAGKLGSEHTRSSPGEIASDVWWWD